MVCVRRMLHCNRRRHVLATVLDRFASHQEPIYLVAVDDFNVRLDHSDDQHDDQFCLLTIKHCYNTCCPEFVRRALTGGGTNNIQLRNNPQHN